MAAASSRTPSQIEPSHNGAPAHQSLAGGNRRFIWRGVSLAQSFNSLEMFRRRQRPAVFECVHDRMSISQECGILSWKGLGGMHRVRGPRWQEVQDEGVIDDRITDSCSTASATSPSES